MNHDKEFREIKLTAEKHKEKFEYMTFQMKEIGTLLETLTQRLKRVKETLGIIEE